MKSIISLAGDIGAGKGTVGKMLVNSLGYNFLSTGNILREIASNLNMTIVELNKYAATHKEVDDEADNRLMDIESNADNIIVDSRLAWHFIPSSFKVYLSVSYENAAKRIYNDQERKAEKIESVDSLLIQIKERRRLELDRFYYLYGVQCDSYENYNIIIQTDHVSPESILAVILAEYKKRNDSNSQRRIYLSPTSLIPLESVRKLSGGDAEVLVESVCERGFDANNPILVVEDKGFYYIWDGHKRCSAALLNKVPLVPARLIANENFIKLGSGISVENYINGEYKRKYLYDWEDCHEFRFSEYPS